MKKRYFAVVGLISLALLVPLHQANAGRELDGLINEALNENPGVRAHGARAEAAQARIPQAGSLEDPRIGFRASNFPTSNLGLNNTPMTGLDLTLAQKIPFPGKRSLRKKAEQSMATATSSLYAESQNQLRFQVSETYYQLYRTDQVTRVVRDNLSLLDKLAKTAETRYSAGEASGPDVFRAQTFRSQLEKDLLALRQERKSLTARMNTLVNRPALTPLRLRYGFRMNRPPRRADWETAVDERPLLKAFDSQVDAAKTRERLARHDYLPDFDFSVGYRIRGNAPGDPVRGSDFISGGVNLNIPLWAYWRQSKKVQEQAAQKMAAAHQRNAVHNDSVYQATDSYERVRRQYRQLNLYRTRLLPESRATYESSITAYESGQAKFFETIEALRDRYEMEREYYVLKANYEISHAQLKWVLGWNDTKEVSR